MIPARTSGWTNCSQAYQANLVQFAAEAYRRARYDPMQGIFHFMFVDDWPSITWSVVNYYRQPKAGYYLALAIEPPAGEEEG